MKVIFFAMALFATANASATNVYVKLLNANSQKEAQVGQHVYQAVDPGSAQQYLFWVDVTSADRSRIDAMLLNLVIAGAPGTYVDYTSVACPLGYNQFVCGKVASVEATNF